MAASNKKYAKPVYLVDGNRTPFIKARGRPGPFRHADLGIYAARPLLLRMPFEPGDIDEVIFGSTMALLYLASTLYHAAPPGRVKQVLRRLDHGATGPPNDHMFQRIPFIP